MDNTLKVYEKIINQDCKTREILRIYKRISIKLNEEMHFDFTTQEQEVLAQYATTEQIIKYLSLEKTDAENASGPKKVLEFCYSNQFLLVKKGITKEIVALITTRYPLPKELVYDIKSRGIEEELKALAEKGY